MKEESLKKKTLKQREQTSNLAMAINDVNHLFAFRVCSQRERFIKPDMMNRTYFLIPGQCLNFNCMFVLVLMLRQTITFLRTRGFSSYLPLDQHIYFHKLTGTLIAIYSLIHTISHLSNFSEYLNKNPKVTQLTLTKTFSQLF